MKQLFYVLSLFCVTSCGQKSNQEQERITIDSSESMVTQIIDTNVFDIKLTEPDSVESVTILKNYALGYKPWEIVLPEAPDSVLNAMKVVKSSSPDEFEKYLTLIFLKLCKARLKCCYETYKEEVIIVKHGPLVTEFKELTKKYLEKRQFEFSPSRTAYNYVYDNQYLRKFRPINREYNLITELLTLEDF